MRDLVPLDKYRSGYHTERPWVQWRILAICLPFVFVGLSLVALPFAGSQGLLWTLALVFAVTLGSMLFFAVMMPIAIRFDARVSFWLLTREGSDFQARAPESAIARMPCREFVGTAHNRLGVLYLLPDSLCFVCLTPKVMVDLGALEELVIRTRPRRFIWLARLVIKRGPLVLEISSGKGSWCFEVPDPIDSAATLEAAIAERIGDRRSRRDEAGGAACGVHPELAAEFLCQRCGGFYCRSCLADAQAGYCIDCHRGLG